MVMGVFIYGRKCMYVCVCVCVCVSVHKWMHFGVLEYYFLNLIYKSRSNIKFSQVNFFFSFFKKIFFL